MLAIMRAVVALVLCIGPLACFASSRVQGLLQQADEIRSSNPARFQQLLAELLPLQKEASVEQSEKITYLQAYSDVYAGRCDAASLKAEQLIQHASDPDIKARSSALIVNCAALTRQFLNGLREIDRLSVLTERAKLPETRQHSLFASANLYDQVGQYALALRDVTTLLEKTGELSPRNYCFSAQLQLDLLERMKQLPDDQSRVQKLIDLCSSLGEPMVANFGRIVLAHQLVASGQRARAEELLRTHLHEMELTQYPRLITEAKALLAELLLEDGDLAAAAHFANEAVADGKADRGVLPLVTANRVLYEIAQRQGNIAAAFEHYRAFAEADKAYLNEIKTRELAYQIVRQENAQKTQQIQLLNRQNSLLQLQQRVEQQKAANSRLLMLFFAVFTLLVALWGYRTKRVQLSMRKMAETDALTGICNRHHFTALAEQTLAQCARNGSNVALIMLDLDHFKSINDNYGHVTGDWVLKQVAKVGQGLCRPVDHFGRLGGEEFAILLNGCDLKAATRVAEDFRVRIGGIQSADSGFNFRITASFGVTCSMMAAYDLDKLLSQADQMLYRAKREGRDRVVAFAHELPMELRGPLPHPGPERKGDAVASAALRTSKA